MLKRLLLATLLLLLPTSAYAAFDAGDIICETSTTTGTGTLNLAGAVTNYATFVSQITSGSTVNYHIRASDGKLETGVGTFTDATPDTLSRTAYWSTDGSGAELTLPAGTHTVCLGPTIQMFAAMKGFQLYNDDAGAVGGILPFWHDSTSAEDGDIAADIQVYAGADDEEVGRIALEVDDGATASEDTRWRHFIDVAGTSVEALTVTDPVQIGDGVGFVIGHTTQLAVPDVNDSATTPEFQVLGSGSADSSIAFIRHQTGTTGPYFIMGKSKNAAVGSHTIVADGDDAGAFVFVASDGTDFENVANILAEVDGTPGADDMPGRIGFFTTAVGATTSTRRLTAFANGGIVIGGGLTSPGAEDLSLEGGTLEWGNAGTAGTDTTMERSAAGELTLEGDAVKHAGKQSMYVPASAMRNSATSSASCGDTYDSGSNDLTITVCAFDTGATEERAEFGIFMPKAWNESTVTFQPISTCAGACAAGETLQYELACAAISSEETMNSAQGTPQSSSKTLQATPTNELLLGAESSAITIANTPAENDYVHCRISRDTSADNMAGDALLIGIKFFWTDNASTLAE